MFNRCFQVVFRFRLACDFWRIWPLFWCWFISYLRWITYVDVEVYVYVHIRNENVVLIVSRLIVWFLLDICCRDKISVLCCRSDHLLLLWLIGWKSPCVRRVRWKRSIRFLRELKHLSFIFNIRVVEVWWNQCRCTFEVVIGQDLWVIDYLVKVELIKYFFLSSFAKDCFIWPLHMFCFNPLSFTVLARVTFKSLFRGQFL